MITNRQKVLTGGELDDFGVSMIKRMPSEQQQLQYENDRKSEHNSGMNHKDALKQPQTEDLSSYLSIRQVQSKEIAVANVNNSIQNKNDDSKSIKRPIIISANSYQNKRINNQTDDPHQQKQYLSSLINSMVTELVLFRKEYIRKLQSSSSNSQQQQDHAVVVTLTVRDVLDFMNASLKQKEDHEHTDHLSHHIKFHLNHKNRTLSEHLPLSLNPNSNSNNIFSIDEYNPINIQECLSQQNTLHHRQSISLFSRMMKENLPMTQKNNDHIIKEQPYNQPHQHLLLSLQSTLFTLQLLLSNAITAQQQQTSQSSSHQLRSCLSNIVKNKIIQSFSNNQTQSIFNHCNFDLKQRLLLTDNQIQLTKENIVLYVMIVKQILLVLKETDGQLYQPSYNYNYKSKSTDFSSFPTFTSRSLSSFPSNPLTSKSIKQNAVQKICVDLFSTELLMKKVKQNKLKYHRKAQKLNKGQNYCQMIKFTIKQLAEFRTLLYDVWLIAMQKKQEAIQYSNDGDQSIFIDIYQLLPIGQQALSYLVFVLKELEFNFISNLQLTSQQFLLTDSVLKKSNITYHNEKSLQIEQPLESQISTKRINGNKIDYHKINQLQQTRNNYFDEQYINNRPQNGFTPKYMQNLSQYNKSQNTLKKQENNSSSKLTLSRLYQFKLDNIRKKTQKINIQAEKVKLTLLNKAQSSKSILSKPYQHHQSTSNLKTKQELMRSKNPTDHQQHIKILELKSALIQKNAQLQQKQNLIKKLMLLNEINYIDSLNNKKHLQTICSKKVQAIRNKHKQRLELKEDQIKQIKQDLYYQKCYTTQISQQKKIEAKLFVQSNQLYNLKKCLISEKQRQRLKNKSSQSLANLKKGCYKEFYFDKNKQNIHELSNITSREESMSLLMRAEQEGKSSSQLKNTYDGEKQLQLSSQNDLILNKIKKVQQKIVNQNKSAKRKFFERS